MSEDVFRWIVSVAVILACISFIGQTLILATILRAGKKAQEAGKDIQSKVAPLIERVYTISETTSRILETTSRILDENRPRVADITTDAVAITKTARQQATHISELIDDTNARARVRIAQVDHAVEETVVQVEQVSEAVKSAILRPAKEVNGILNGMKAAVNSYAEGRRRPSVDHVTQDEEMFI